MGKGRSHSEREGLVKPALNEELKNRLITSHTTSGKILTSVLAELEGVKREQAIEQLIQEGLVQEERTQVLVRDREGKKLRESRTDFRLTARGERLAKKLRQERYRLALQNSQARQTEQLLEKLNRSEFAALGLAERDILFHLMILFHQSKQVYPNQAYFKKTLGIPTKPLRAALDNLQKQGRILRQAHCKPSKYLAGHPAYYTLTGEGAQLFIDLTAYANLTGKPFEQLAQKRVYQAQKL